MLFLYIIKGISCRRLPADRKENTMQNYIKRGLSLFLCFAMVFALSACSGRAMTEENITNTVELVEKALREFDRETLQKYVSSKTLDYIIRFANNKEQFDTIGKLLFEKLELNIQSIDVENQAVTLEIKNRDMTVIADRYVKLIKDYSNGGKTLDMVKLLSDDEFLDISVRSITSQIAYATEPDNPTVLTVSVSRGAKNLVLNLDEEAEDAVSGGVVSVISDAFSLTGDNEEETAEG